MTSMLICGRCEVSNPPGFRFCGGCGGPLEAVACPVCQSPIAVGQRFCGSCGSELGGAGGTAAVTALAGPGDGSPPTEERKLATIVFADVVGFTTMAEDRDHEFVAETVARAFTRLTEIVVEHGGTVDKFMGDCLMAVFGVPVAHDDDAERAVAAALAMRDVDSDLRFSIGVNSGEVMATAMPGEGRLTVIGDTVNVASRLEKAAGAGEVLVGALTAQLAGDRVSFREREPMVLKGKREPVPVLEALALRVRDDGTAGVARPPLVGRDAELEFLLSRWRRVVLDGCTEAVILIGDVGIGKSRLLDELIDKTGAEGRVVRTAYPAYGGPGGTRMAAELVRQLGHVGDEAVDLRLSSLIGEETSGDLLALDATAFQQEQLWAFRRLIESRAAEQPLLIVLDEVQRAAERTLEFLVELVARVDAPVLLILAGRPEPVEWLTRFPATTTLRLWPLGADDAATLASALVPEGVLSATAAAGLAVRAAGNPLHIRELVRLVRERQGLVSGGTGIELAGNLTLPPSLHAVLAARLDALPSAEKSALQFVALLGEDADDGAVEQMGLAGAGDALRRLVTGGLLREHEGGYQISDPLLRDVAYESLPRAVRGALHKRAAAAANTDYDRARHLDQAVGFLAGDAGLRAEAAAALTAAGRRMITMHRTTDALALLGRAAELGERRPDALLQLASLQADLSRDEDALRTLDLIPSSDDGTVEAERVHVAANALTRTRPAEAVELYRQARQRWVEAGNPTKEGWALANSAVALTYMGRMVEASEVMTQALEIFERLGDRMGMDSGHQLLGFIHPDDPRVEGWFADGLRFAEEAGDRGRQRYALLNLSLYHYLRARLGGPGDVDTAERYSLRVQRLATEMNDVPATAQGMVIAALVARDSGQLDTAIARMAPAAGLAIDPRAGFAVLRDAGVLVTSLLVDGAAPLPHLPVAGGDAIAVLGGVIAAHGLTLAGRFAEAGCLIDEGGDVMGLPTVQLVVGGITSAMCHVLSGQHAESTSALVAVIAAADSMHAGPTAAAARGLLAECLVRAGDRDGAARVLESVPQPLPGGVAGALLHRAHAVLGDEGARAELEKAAAELRAPGLLEGL